MPPTHPNSPVLTRAAGGETSYASAMGEAFRVAALSPDPSTQNGGVLLTSAGAHAGISECNRFPDGVAARFERPAKYAFMEHAERGVIYAAARRGIPTEGTTLVCAWAACADCARAIVQAGIRTLVRARFDDGAAERWRESVAVGDEIMTEAGVSIIEMDIAGLSLSPLLRDGALWTPGA